MPRLLWLTEHYWPGRGGMAVSCERIVHALRRRGVWVEVVHFKTRHEMAPAVREGGRDRVVQIRPDSPHALSTLWNSLKGETYTHVVAFGGHLPFVAGPVYAAWLGLPLVTCLRGNDFDTGIFWPERRPALEDAIRRAERVGCVTESLCERVRALFPQARAAWTPNGIELESWRALPSDRRRAAELRAAHLGELRKPHAGRRILGLFGELKAKKGVETLLEGIARAGLGSRFHLFMTGALGCPVENLTVTSLPSLPRTDLIPWMLACDAVALPSLYEGMPNVLLEAAALGVPLVASEAGAAGVLKDGVHGVVFKPGDADACRVALQNFLAGNCSREQLQTLARTFSAEAESDRWLELLGHAPRKASVTRLSGAGA